MGDSFLGKHTIFDYTRNSRPACMTHIWIGRLRLHIFYRGDAYPDCHDHPWCFWTFPFTSYVEEVATPSAGGGFRLDRQVVHAFRLTYRPATYCHRVIGRWTGEREIFGGVGGTFTGDPIPKANDRKVITIVWRGRKERKWGFLKNRDGRWCWLPWKEYVFGGGKHATCEPDAVQPPQTQEPTHD